MGGTFDLARGRGQRVRMCAVFGGGAMQTSAHRDLHLAVAQLGPRSKLALDARAQRLHAALVGCDHGEVALVRARMPEAREDHIAWEEVCLDEVIGQVPDRLGYAARCARVGRYQIDAEHREAVAQLPAL